MLNLDELSIYHEYTPLNGNVIPLCQYIKYLILMPKNNELMWIYPHIDVCSLKYASNHHYWPKIGRNNLFLFWLRKSAQMTPELSLFWYHIDLEYIVDITARNSILPVSRDGTESSYNTSKLRLTTTIHHQLINVTLMGDKWYNTQPRPLKSPNVTIWLLKSAPN